MRAKGRERKGERERKRTEEGKKRKVERFYFREKRESE